MKTRRFILTLEISVFEPRELIRVARNKAEEQGCGRAAVSNTQDAVQWMFDNTPDEVLSSAQIDSGSVQEITELEYLTGDH